MICGVLILGCVIVALYVLWLVALFPLRFYGIVLLGLLGFVHVACWLVCFICFVLPVGCLSVDISVAILVDLVYGIFEFW